MRLHEIIKPAKSLSEVVDPLELPPSFDGFDVTEEILSDADCCP